MRFLPLSFRRGGRGVRWIVTPGGGGGGIEDEKSGFEIAGENVDSTQMLLSQLVDGGNTEQLNTDVQSSIPPDALPLYNDLMGKSPYLSDTVMITAVNKEDVLSSSMVTDILSANPQAAKSEEIMDQVENRINPLTDEQMSQVLEGLTETGGKEILEGEIAGSDSD